MRINVHAGHGADGSKSCGAIGLIKESTEARKVKDLVIKMLKEKGHIVYDCTVDNPSNASDCLNKIVSKCNANRVDLNISIHFNSGANDKNGDGNTKGVEVLIYNDKTKDIANRICASISKLGYRNRGAKINTGLAVLRKTKDKAVLVECCFVDDKDDIKIYNPNSIAKAIVEGVLNIKLEEKEEIKDSKNYALLYSNDVDKVAAEILKWGIPNSTILSVNDYKGNGYWGVIAVGGATETSLRNKYPNINFTVIKGSSRFETVKSVLKYLNK